MRKFFLLLTFLFISIFCSAQTENIEATIRALEQTERKAVIAHDTVTLLQLWAPDFTVNAPMNQIAKGGRNTLDRTVMQRVYSTFERQTEMVMVKGDMAISMGNELVVERNKDGSDGSPIRRRYTNIWQKQGADWLLIARHANNICQTP